MFYVGIATLLDNMVVVYIYKGKGIPPGVVRKRGYRRSRGLAPQADEDPSERSYQGMLGVEYMKIQTRNEI